MKNAEKTKINIISLGCPKNLIDSEVMGGFLRQSGHALVDKHTDADLVIINTCAFINPAKEEAIDEITKHYEDLNLSESLYEGLLQMNALEGKVFYGAV